LLARECYATAVILANSFSMTYDVIYVIATSWYVIWRWNCV